MNRTVLVIALTTTIVAPAYAIQAGAPDAVALKAQNGQLGDSLGPFTSVRELRNGLVLVAKDATGLWLGDFGAGRFEKVSGVTTGGRSATTYALGGDSTVVQVSRNWILLVGPAVSKTLSLSDSSLGPSGTVLGLDTLGTLLKSVEATQGDSVPLLSIARKTGTSRLLTRLYRGPADYLRSVREYATIFPDGWIAVLRAQPWRVDWLQPDGKWIHGAPLPIPQTILDAREKAFISQLEAPFRGSGSSRPDSDFPRVREPFETGLALLAAPNGVLLIERTPHADEPGRTYEIVDRTGALVGAVEVNGGDHIVGFGRSSVYVRSSRGDRWPARLERHPWP